MIDHRFFKTAVRHSFPRTVVTNAITKRHQMVSASLGHSRASFAFDHARHLDEVRCVVQPAAEEQLEG
jgi:hypothetical protein